jgi:hypothetical protein
VEIQLHEFTNSVLGYLIAPAAVNARKVFWYPKKRELGRTQSQCECCEEAFNCLGYIKKYADSGTRTNIVFSEGYC